jgi:internalin A
LKSEYFAVLPMRRLGGDVSMLRWIKIAVLAITISVGFGGSPSFAEPSSRKVSDYKSFTEICLDRENLPKATKESIESLLSGHLTLYGGVNKPSCDEVGQKLSATISLISISDLNLLRFIPNVDYLSIDGDKVISDFSSLESLGKLQKLVLKISSLDRLGNIKLKHLRVLYLTITGDRLASDVNAFKMMPKFAEFSKSNDTNYNPTGNIVLVYKTPSGFRYVPPSISLVLNGDNLTDISALQSAKGVVILKLQGRQISNISALSPLTHLKSLVICRTRVSDASHLSSLVNLDYLTLEGNRITDFTPLGSLAQKLLYGGSRACRN